MLPEQQFSLSRELIQMKTTMTAFQLSIAVWRVLLGSIADRFYPFKKNNYLNWWCKITKINLDGRPIHLFLMAVFY